MMQEKVPVPPHVIAACHPTSVLLGVGGVATPLGLSGAPLGEQLYPIMHHLEV